METGPGMGTGSRQCVVFVELDFLGASQIPSTVIWETHELQSLPEIGAGKLGTQGPPRTWRAALCGLGSPSHKNLEENPRSTLCSLNRWEKLAQLESLLWEKCILHGICLEPCIFQRLIPKQLLLKSGSPQHGKYTFV